MASCSLPEKPSRGAPRSSGLAKDGSEASGPAPRIGDREAEAEADGGAKGAADATECPVCNRKDSLGPHERLHFSSHCSHLISHRSHLLIHIGKSERSSYEKIGAREEDETTESAAR